MSAVELAGGTFYRPGRRWGGGEASGGGGVLIPVSFKRVKGEEETGRRRLDGKLEGDDPTLRFDFTRVREGGGGVTRNNQRWESIKENGPSGLCRPVG
jgi:hypothetical protein